MLSLKPVSSSLLLSSLTVSVVSFLVYYNSLWGGLVFDDHRAILTNDDLDSEKTSIWGVFTNDFWGGHMSRSESHKSYRPLTVLTYRYFNFWFSRLEPFTYHLVNVLLHVTASLQFLLVCIRLLGRSWPSLYAALLFSVHSVHTESVASVVGRAEALACNFFLLGLLLYMRGVSTGRGNKLAVTKKTKWPYLLLSIMMSMLAMLSKEQGVTVLGVCAAFDVFINWDVINSNLWTRKKDKESTTSEEKSKTFNDGSTNSNRHLDGSNNCRNSHINGLSIKSIPGKNKKLHGVGLEIHSLILRIGCLLVSGVGLVWLRMSMNYGTQPIFKPYEMRAAFHPDRLVRMMSFSNLYCHNAWLMLCPLELCCDWSLGSVPLVASINDHRNLYSLTLYLTLTVLLIHLLHSSRDRIVTGMGMVLLLGPFFPASGILLTVGFVIAERVLYMPSLGFCLLVAIGLRRLTATLPKSLGRILHTASFGLLLVTALKTVSRNEDWRSDMALFISGVKVNPNNVKLRNNLGMELKAAGRLEEAQHQYMLSMEIDPDYGEVYFNYGNLLSDAGHYEKAAKYFEKSLENPTTYVKTLNNLATMYYRLGRWTESEQLYRETLEKSGEHETTYNNLASLYGATNRFKESEELFHKAIELNPSYTEAYFNLGTLYIQMERYAEAELNLKRALELNPAHHGATNNLKAVETLQAQRREGLRLTPSFKKH